MPYLKFQFINFYKLTIKSSKDTVYWHSSNYSQNVHWKNNFVECL